MPQSVQLYTMRVHVLIILCFRCKHQLYKPAFFLSRMLYNDYYSFTVAFPMYFAHLPSLYNWTATVCNFKSCGTALY